MSEFVTIQVGQCGNQIGSSFWPSVLDEYGIQYTHEEINKTNKTVNHLQSSINSFFAVPPSKTCLPFNSVADMKEGRVKARAILVDMEESVVSRFKTGNLRDIFDSRCFISSSPGCGNNWATGYCYNGPRYENQILNIVRRSVEKCDSLQGFILLFSVGGGTGSGLGTYILQILEEHFPEVERLVSCVYPTGTEDVITCPYNMALSTEYLTEYATCVFPVENRALLEIVNRQFNNKSHMEKLKSSIVEFKPFFDMNNIIVNMLLHLTSGSRFHGDLNVDINEINTNMVPFPKLHFLSSSLNPLFPSTSKFIQKPNSQQIRDEIFRNACNKNCQLLKIDPLGLKSVLLGSTLMGRGDYTISDMRNYVDNLQSKGHFTSWSRKSIKTGLCSVPPSGYSTSMMCLFNTTAMATLFSHILTVYKKLYKKKAHVHHYTEVPGFDENCFESCQSSLSENIELYKNLEHSDENNLSDT